MTPHAQAIAELVAHHFQVNATEVVPSLRLAEDLGADSLDVVALVLEVEAKTGARLPDSALLSIKTVGDLSAKVEEIMGQQSTS